MGEQTAFWVEGEGLLLWLVFDHQRGCWPSVLPLVAEGKDLLCRQWVYCQSATFIWLYKQSVSLLVTCNSYFYSHNSLDSSHPVLNFICLLTDSSTLIHTSQKIKRCREMSDLFPNIIHFLEHVVENIWRTKLGWQAKGFAVALCVVIFGTAKMAAGNENH